MGISRSHQSARPCAVTRRALSQAVLAACLMLGASVAAAQAPAGPSAQAHYDIPAGTLDQVLNRFASSAGFMLVIDATLTAGKTSPGLSGSHTPREGLATILAGGSLEAEVYSRQLVTDLKSALDELPLVCQQVYVRHRLEGWTHEEIARAMGRAGSRAHVDGTTYEVKRTLDLPAHPNSLALMPDGDTLYVTVKAPHGDKHPAWRADSLDSVVRMDLR